MRVLVAIEPADKRKGIDGLVRLCQDSLAEDPFSDCVFVFRSRDGATIRLLNYDGQGRWLAQKRLSKRRFIRWPDYRKNTFLLRFTASAEQLRRRQRYAAILIRNTLRELFPKKPQVQAPMLC